MRNMADITKEKALIEQVIRSSITWAIKKDKESMYKLFVHDSTLFFFGPDNGSNVCGIEQFTKQVDEVFMNPAFKAIGSEFRDMRINLSQSGDVAWWSCFLDDRNEWNGRPASWENVRWTGVLEKRDGNWVIMQMHFSYSVEDMQAANKPNNNDSKTDS